VTGCYAQRAPQELAALPGVTWVVGNSHKHQAAEIATLHRPVPDLFRWSNFRVGNPTFATNAKEWATAEIVVGDIFAHTELLAAPGI
jgi:threonylcarbamoyladenosine tRNA methylthiotransferase MtaB